MVCRKNFINRYKSDLVFALLFMLAAFLIFWRCRYGYANNDEIFYLTIPYRLSMGDALFVDEWHVTQMAGLLLLPFLSLYKLINGSLEGIVLCARYFCVFIQCLLAVYMYIRLRKFSFFGAAAATLGFLLFIPFNISALSYNSMGIMAAIASAVTIISAHIQSKFQLLFAGILFSVSVLCNPFLVLAYLAFFCAIAIYSLIARKQGNVKSQLLLCSFLYFTAGCVICAILFFGFVLSRCSVSAFIAAVPQLFNDPSHKMLPLSQTIVSFFTMIYEKPNRFAYISLLILFMACLIDKRRYSRVIVYFPLASLFCLYLMFTHFREVHINLIMWAINVIAPFLFLLSQKSILKKVFIFMWIPGIMYAFLNHMSSNMEFYAVSSAASIAAVATLFMLGIFLEEYYSKNSSVFFKRIICILAVIIMLFQISSEAFLRYKTVFWDHGIDTQYIYIYSGVHSGIYISPLWHDVYEPEKKALSVLSEYDIEKVLFLSLSTWFYLESDYEFASFSAWLEKLDDNMMSRLGAYYEMHPEKLPDAVYVERGRKDLAEKFCDTFGYIVNDHNVCLILTPKGA